jgi:ribose transport system substrate-binding protein
MCKAAGIPVIGIDIPVGDAPYCGGDNYQAGSICGTELGKAAMEKWNGQVDLYISVETMSNLQTNTLRNGGIIDGIRSQIELPDDKIVRVDAKDKMELAQSLVTDVLTAHPDAQHILIGCHQDDETAGAFAAVEIAGRQDQVILGGNGPFASTLANFRLPEPNFWIGSTSFVPEKYGFYAIPLMINLIQGNSVQNNTYFEHYWLTWENCEEHYPAGEFVVK